MKFILSLLVIFMASATIAQESNPDEQLIRAELDRQQQCWNNGNIECFMDGYWKSDSLKFIGSKGIKYGWQETLDNYHKSYPDKAAMGKLTFDLLSLEPIGTDHYLVTGKWHLKRKEDEPNGLFTLVWRKMDGVWKIIYDHSS